MKANAAPILRWLGEAADESDQDARYMALGRHWSNAYFATPSRLWPSEDSARFLASAEQYYAFLTA
ncbi:hypothetical protein [Thermomonospora umbrina]|uniref:hypothetical protein n=1 Tax=Thermomonospora umbrina TaxID=111806 RepID=UPI0011C191C6|nr:hypothetical protein [Thermomonospora umbrina]